MEEISQYFKRKDRKTSSESSESVSNSPEDKRTKLSAPCSREGADNNMAVDIIPKLQDVLEKPTGLDKKVDSINKHVGSIDKRVNQLQEKVTTLEISLNANVKTVSEVENGMSSINVDVEELKKERDKLSKEVNALRQQQWYQETYQRREIRRFYGIPEQLEGKEIARDALFNFFVNELK